MEKHSMPALPDWPDRDVQTRFSPAAIPQPAPPPDTGPTVQWPTPRRSRRALLAGVLLGLTGLSVAGAVIVSTCTLCYAVSTDGSPPLAYVQGEDTYQTAVRQVEDQVSEILRSDYRYAQETTMALTIAPKNSLQTSDQLTASLMETVDQVKAEYILTIDGLPIGACESREAIDQDQGTLPLLTVCTVEEVTYTQPVEPPVQEVEDSTLLLGEEKVLSQGTPGLEERTDRVTYTMGQEQSRENMSRNRLAQATPTQVAVGTAQGVEGAKGRFLWPLRGRITSPFGGRQIFGGENFHRGLDIAAPSGTPIAASAGGQVIWAGPKGTYGNLVKIDHGNGFTTYYAHCSELLVQEGDQVTQGQTIALVGSTGRSTGPHCHFELLWQDELLDPQLCLP